MRLRTIATITMVTLAIAACGGSGQGQTATPTRTATATASSSRPTPTTSAPRTTAAKPATRTPTGAAPTRPASYPDWPTYHLDGARTGHDPSMPPVGTSHSLVWSVALDGAAYAEPLVISDTAIVATENNTVYAIRDNAIVWRTHLAEPVPLSTLACGNIDPLGITGTPVYDASRGLIFAVVETRSSNGAVVHQLYALTTTGHVQWSRNVDPPGSSPAYQQQRAALAIAGGSVVIAFGGLDGDCVPYHGWVVGVRTDNRGWTYRRIGSSEAGIWAPSGPAVDAAGHYYVAVGNGTTSSTYDDSDSVLKFSGTTLLSYFSPANWQQQNSRDLDLGSQGPALVGNWVFADGKGGNGYLLNPANLGGIGHPSYARSLCASFGGTAYANGIIYVPCRDGLRAVQITSGPSLKVLWHQTFTGSPVVGGGHVWVVSGDTLYELSPSTGVVQASWTTGAVTRFTTPTLHGHLVIVATHNAVKAWQLS